LGKKKVIKRGKRNVQVNTGRSSVVSSEKTPLIVQLGATKWFRQSEKGGFFFLREKVNGECSWSVGGEMGRRSKIKHEMDYAGLLAKPLYWDCGNEWGQVEERANLTFGRTWRREATGLVPERGSSGVGVEAPVTRTHTDEKRTVRAGEGIGQPECPLAEGRPQAAAKRTQEVDSSKETYFPKGEKNASQHVSNGKALGLEGGNGT